MENMPATGGGTAATAQAGPLGTPLVLGILEIWYPTSTRPTFDLIVANANWWFTLHILQLPLFGLMALAVYLLVDGLSGGRLPSAASGHGSSSSSISRSIP